MLENRRKGGLGEEETRDGRIMFMGGLFVGRPARGSAARGAWAATASMVSLLAASATSAGAADAPAPGAATGVSTTIEEVTVTARKRTERLIDVPVAATVVTGETLARYDTTDPSQLSILVPSLQIQRTAGGTPGSVISIWGISVIGPDYGSEQPVSVVIDGIPVTRGHVIDTGFFDQSSVDVLEGPQALFYGKNSPAGVVDIHSVNPGDKFEGYVRGSYGVSEKDPQLEGAVSLPVTNTLSVRLAVRAEDMQGGFVTNTSHPLPADPIPDPILGGAATPLPGANFKTYPQTKELMERFTAVWKPTPNFDATLKILGSYYHTDASTGGFALTNCAAAGRPTYVDALSGTPYVDTGATCAGGPYTNDATPPAQILQNFRGAPSNGQYYTRTQNFLTSLDLDYHLPHLTLTSVTGYYRLHAGEFDNYDVTVFAETPDVQLEKTTTFTQELRAATDFDFPVNVTAGAFFEHEHRTLWNTNRIFLLPTLPAGLTNQEAFAGVSNSMIGYDVNNTTDYSVFAEATWKILPNLELAGGGRYTEAYKKASLDQEMQALDQFYPTYQDALLYSSLTPAGVVYNIKTHYTNFSPQITLSWHPVRDVLVYAAYKTGFLAGGIANPGVVTNYTQLGQSAIDANLTFAPERDEGGEVGVKGAFLDGRLRGDATLFHYTYYGLQIATFHPQTTTFTIGNAASAIDQGIEAKASYLLSRDVSVRASVVYVPLRFRTYGNAPCYPGQGCSGSTQDLSHTAFGGPPLSMDFGATLHRPINAAYAFTLEGDVQVYDRTPLISLQPDTATPAHSFVNATARIYQSNGPLAFSVIGTDLNGDNVVTVTGSKPLGEPQDIYGVVNPGREVRLQVDYRF